MTDTTMGAMRPPASATVMPIILAVSFCHFLNDIMQSLLASIYPILKAGYNLDFWQIGLLTFTFQVTASLLQPAIGHYTDRHPMPYSLPWGMASTMCGLVLLAFAGTYPLLLLGAGLIGIGSAIFHPESSRVARLASGGRYGMAQSFFQVGGNLGTAAGPLLAAFIVVPQGQESVAWFTLLALVGMIVLWRVSAWYSGLRRATAGKAVPVMARRFTRLRVGATLGVLAVLVFTKNIYTASFTSYYTFYAIERFGVSVETSQTMLFVFLGSMALGLIAGGPIGDRIGAKRVIWFSILGVLPFTLALPYADLTWTIVLSGIVGIILSSAFPAIVVFAQELVPGRVGMIAGLFFGFAFGMGGIAAAVLGVVADARGIEFVFLVCSFLPFLGLLTIFLPNMREA